MGERIRGFLRTLFSAAGQCIGEEIEVLPLAIVVMTSAGILLLAYELIFDPDAVNISSRLATLSVNPDKWL